jgi:hypothetical protein
MSRSFLTAMQERFSKRSISALIQRWMSGAALHFFLWYTANVVCCQIREDRIRVKMAYFVENAKCVINLAGLQFFWGDNNRKVNEYPCYWIPCTRHCVRRGSFVEHSRAWDLQTYGLTVNCVLLGTFASYHTNMSGKRPPGTFRLLHKGRIRVLSLELLFEEGESSLGKRDRDWRFCRGRGYGNCGETRVVLTVNTHTHTHTHDCIEFRERAQRHHWTLETCMERANSSCQGRLGGMDVTVTPLPWIAFSLRQHPSAFRCRCGLGSLFPFFSLTDCGLCASECIRVCVCVCAPKQPSPI